ncbi:MAG: hypothetical protein QOE56_344 [Solirubrobacterales bacterium]|jgi:hypothetical protein|nr:hypothetical protein [Solirubrobacterales bacterium]
MSRIRRGWALTKKSWALLNGHRELIRFPLYGAVATVLLAIVFLGPGLYLLDQDSLGGAIPLLVLGVYVLSVVGFYFSVGLAAAANLLFNGQTDVTVADGLAVARSRFTQICGWAAVSTAISVLMGVLENQGGLAGNIAARLIGMAWSLITFLAVPVIAIEGTGPFETLKRSASIFKERWGQQITGNVAIGAAVGLIGVLPAIILIVAGIAVWSSASFLGALLVVIGALVLAIAILVGRALSGIFGVALYRYAVDGQAVGGFTQEELESAVRVKRSRRGSPPTATPGTV